MNLLEHLIMLYVRVSIFSLVKDTVCELHKLNHKRKKLDHCELKSKKASSSLEQGHGTKEVPNSDYNPVKMAIFIATHKKKHIIFGTSSKHFFSLLLKLKFRAE